MSLFDSDTVDLKAIVGWLNAAIANRDIGAAMTYYCVRNGFISSTDGRLTAGFPWPFDHNFLVPGTEFEKVLARMQTGRPEIVIQDKAIKIKSGRFSGTIQTLPLEDWQHGGIDKETKWQPIPKDLPGILKSLRPFLSENTSRLWANCVALDNGWAYATNNIAVAGAKCKGLAGIKVMLPSYTLDFLLPRFEEITQWAWDENFVAFRWSNKAWMKSKLIIGSFPEKAAQMVQQAQAEKPTQEISDELRKSFVKIAELGEDTLLIYANCIRSRFGKAIVEEMLDTEVPKGQKASIWGAKFLLPVILAADRWSPACWPAPAPFKGPVVSGFVVGRKA